MRNASSSSEGSGGLSSSWRDGGMMRKPKVSPGHPVQVTEVCDIEFKEYLYKDLFIHYKAPFVRYSM